MHRQRLGMPQILRCRSASPIAALALAAGILLLLPATQARADAPDQPMADRATALNSSSVRVSFENFANEAYGPNDCDGCAELLHFDIRYHPRSDSSGSQYSYVVGDLNDANGNPHAVVDGCLYPLNASCSGAYVEPSAPGFAHYDVTGLSPSTEYCFGVQAVANEIPVFGTASMAYSGYSPEVCATTIAAQPQPTPTATPPCATPPCLLGGPFPQINLSFLAQLAPDVAVITSPSPNQMTHDVQIDVKRAQQNQDNGVFDLQWSYLQGGTWYTPDSGPLDQLDKGSFPNGVTLDNSLFTDFPCGSLAAPCAFRAWRVRARVDGFTLPNGNPLWSDWVQFRVQ
jgi:hypothetical protein